LFAQGQLDFVANVGTLSSSGTPPQLGSHADQMLQWQRGVAHSSSAGWAARLAEIRAQSSNYPVRNLSNQPRNAMQTCAEGLPCMGLGETSHQVGLEGVFPATPFAQDMRAVAADIIAAEQSGSSRQIYFVQMNGWDHHNNLLAKHALAMDALSAGIKAFDRVLADRGLGDQVTTFSASEFGRALQPTGSGTAHGWGGNHFILGGAASGHKLHGEYPSTLALGAGADVNGTGMLKPTSSTEAYIAHLLRWYGVAESELLHVLPGVDSHQLSLASAA